MRLGTNISETVKRKLSLGARILRVGGVEKVFKQFFSMGEGERVPPGGSRGAGEVGFSQEEGKFVVEEPDQGVG